MHSSRYTRVVIRRLKRKGAWIVKSFKSNVGSFLWGTFFTGVLSFGVWMFAYFGFIDLGLPERFEFEKLDRTIRSNIPDNFNYTFEKSKLRNSEYDSLVVTASRKELGEAQAKEDQSDILLILDKTAKSYKVTYKFSARFKNSNVYGFPLHISKLYINDINNDKLNDLVVGWSYLGANYSTPAITILTPGKDSALEVYGVPHLSNHSYPDDYKDLEVYNSFDTLQKVRTDVFYTFFAKNGQFVVISRDDKACNACGEEHIYDLHSFSMYGGNIYESGIPKTAIKGYPKLVELLKSENYKIDIH